MHFVVTWRSLLSTASVFIVVAAPGCLGYSDFGQHFLQNNASGFSIEVNVQPEMNISSLDSLTIFELVQISKLQSFAEDVMCVRRFQEPIWVSTNYLMNLLDSSQWNLKKAKRKFQKAMEYRTKILRYANMTPEKNVFKYFDVQLKGYDREGCPVVILPFGEWRTYRSYVEKIKSIPTANRNLKIYFANIMEGIFQKIGKNLLCSHFTLIVDMEGYIAHHNSGIKFFTDAIKRFMKSYPGLMKMAFMVNSSPEFLKVAQSFKSTIPWDLRQKSFLYTERNFWEAELQKQIHSSQIAPKYGGENFSLE